VALDRLLQHIELAADLARLLAGAELRAGAGPGEEAADTRPAGAHALRQRALRHQLELDLPGLVGGLEAMRVGRARKRADDLAHAPRRDEARQSFIAGPRIVGDADQVAHAGLAQRIQELDRLAHRAEARAQHGGAVLHAGHRLGDASDALVDHRRRSPLPRRFSSSASVRSTTRGASPRYCAGSPSRARVGLSRCWLIAGSSASTSTSMRFSAIALPQAACTAWCAVSRPIFSASSII